MAGKTIVQGKLTLRKSCTLLGTFASACGIGLLIVVFKEPRVLWVGLLESLYPYSTAFHLWEFAYRDWGICCWVYLWTLDNLGNLFGYVGRFDFKVMIVGLPLGFLIANVLWINQYPDYEADMKGNKTG